MKKALIYFEGKPLMSVEYDTIDVKENGHYLYLNKEEQAFVPFNHLMIIKEEPVVKVEFRQSDLNYTAPSYLGGGVTNVCNNTVTVSKKQIDDILSNTIDRNGRLE